MSIISNRFEVDEDFVGAVIDGALLHTRSGVWTISGVGTEAAAIVGSESNAPGIISLGTSGSSGDTCKITYGDAAVALFNQVVDFSVRFRLSSTADITVAAGLFETTLTPIVDTWRGWFQDPAFGTIQSLARDSGGQELLDSSVADSTSFRTVRCRLSGDGALAQTILYDAAGVVLERMVHTARYPGAVAGRFAIQVQTQTGSSKAIEIDRFTLRTQEFAR